MANGQSSCVEAAGGVVWRERDGDVEVLLVHRPKYDDWSLPKGKLEPGEPASAAALREVAEETGLVCELGVPLGAAVYRDRRRRRKRVQYWAMRVRSGRFSPNREVDRIRWVSRTRARMLLSYGHDVEIVASLVDAVARS